MEHTHRTPRTLLVAASVGPYGAILHDGSEYRGDYGLSEDALAQFHAPRMAALLAAAPDLLACETIPLTHRGARDRPRAAQPPRGTRVG
jgi:homocysteine S-methyltransferase